MENLTADTVLEFSEVAEILRVMYGFSVEASLSGKPYILDSNGEPFKNLSNLPVIRLRDILAYAETRGYDKGYEDSANVMINNK